MMSLYSDSTVAKTVTYGNMGETLLTGAEMTQIQLHTKTHSIMGDIWRNLRHLEHTAQPTGSSTGWRVSFQGTSVGRNIFQASQLVYVSLRQ